MSYHQMYFMLTGSKQSNFKKKKYLDKKKEAQIKDVSVDIDSLTAVAPVNRCLKHDSPKQKPCPAAGQ